MTVPGADGCDQLVDDGGDAILLMHKGKEFEEKYAKDKPHRDQTHLRLAGLHGRFRGGRHRVSRGRSGYLPSATGNLDIITLAHMKKM